MEMLRADWKVFCFLISALVYKKRTPASGKESPAIHSFGLPFSTTYFFSYLVTSETCFRLKEEGEGGMVLRSCPDRSGKESYTSDGPSRSMESI